MNEQDGIRHLERRLKIDSMQDKDCSASDGDDWEDEWESSLAQLNLGDGDGPETEQPSASEHAASQDTDDDAGRSDGPGEPAETAKSLSMVTKGKARPSQEPFA